MKYTNKDIELSLWQCFAVVLIAIACLFAIAPLVVRNRSNKCVIVQVEDSIKPQSQNVEASSDNHRRYGRDVSSNDQCSIIPPMCNVPTTMTTKTTRTPVSTVSVTRPVITSFDTSPRPTTPDPWANISRPYNSWRLPNFAKPIDYKLHISCPHCYAWIDELPVTFFYGKLSIRIDVTNATTFLVLHAKNLNITEAKLTSSGGGMATVTYLPEYEMVYLDFFASPIAVGEVTLEIDYIGVLNERDNTGFYREFFWKAIGEISYLLAGNFQPIYARKAFPCFDEPNIQATFSLTLEHSENETVALSNTGVSSQNDSTITFKATPNLSTQSFSWALLPKDEFNSVTKTIGAIEVNIWIRPELLGPSNEYLNSTFDVIEKTFEFLKAYLNVSDADFPEKLDIIGVPDLTLDEKASVSYGLLTFREEFLSADTSLDSAERQQTRTKVIVEHIIQLWFSKTDWWDSIWFGKSLSSFLAYKMIEANYPDFKLMEQFPIREIVPLMMDDFKPNIWPVSNKNLATNEEILDYLSISVYNKGASLLRLLEHIVGDDVFQSAVSQVVSISDTSNILSTFYSNFNFNEALNTTVTAEEFLRSWLEEKNYPIVNVNFESGNESTTVIFRQTRYIGSFALNNSLSDPDYAWKIFVECDLGGSSTDGNWNLTTNHVKSKLKFLFDTSSYTIEIPNENYLWIKCNKDFYSFQVTEYLSPGDKILEVWEHFETLFNDDLLSNNDKADILNNAFILPHGGEFVDYNTTIALIRAMHNNPVSFSTAWPVFVWHWNYLMGVEEHSRYFRNFKQFATDTILALYEYNIDNVVSAGATHQEKLLKSMFFELLCRVQYTDALYKATDLFGLIPESYFLNSTGNTNVAPEFLSTVLYYHIQNANDIDEWEYLWNNFTENVYITAQQRTAFLRALCSAKEIWRLKYLLETASDFDADTIEGQEYFDIIIAISQNPNGRDLAWNFYRHNYMMLLDRFGTSNRLFNQLITNIAQSFENEYYYFEMINFVNQYPSSSHYQQLAIDQILVNFEWFIDGFADTLDKAISPVNKPVSKKRN
ncbi:unnamed protein product [Rotaria magnacalcarata]